MVSIGLIIVVAAVVVGLVFMVLLGVLIPILMNRRNTSSPEDAPEPETKSKEVDKKEILEMLARKEISKDEAETRLSSLENSVPKPQQQQDSSKNNKGCLITVIIGLILLPVIFVLLIMLTLVS